MRTHDQKPKCHHPIGLPLLLPTRKFDTSFSYQRIVSIGPLTDKVMGIGFLTRVFHLLLCHFTVSDAVANILANRESKECGFLLAVAGKWQDETTIMKGQAAK
jgi:hypothetical protein